MWSASSPYSTNVAGSSRASSRSRTGHFPRLRWRSTRSGPPMPSARSATRPKVFDQRRPVEAVVARALAFGGHRRSLPQVITSRPRPLGPTCAERPSSGVLRPIPNEPHRAHSVVRPPRKVRMNHHSMSSPNEEHEPSSDSPRHGRVRRTATRLRAPGRRRTGLTVARRHRRARHGGSRLRTPTGRPGPERAPAAGRQPADAVGRLLDLSQGQCLRRRRHPPPDEAELRRDPEQHREVGVGESWVRLQDLDGIAPGHTDQRRRLAHRSQGRLRPGEVRRHVRSRVRSRCRRTPRSKAHPASRGISTC